MLNHITKIIRNKKTPPLQNFYDFSAKKRKKIINKAVDGANDMQIALIKKYEVLYQNIK